MIIVYFVVCMYYVKFCTRNEYKKCSKWTCVNTLLLLFSCRQSTLLCSLQSPTSTRTGTWLTSPAGSLPPWCPRWTSRCETSPTPWGSWDTTGTASSSTPPTTEPSRSQEAATGRCEDERYQMTSRMLSVSQIKSTFILAPNHKKCLKGLDKANKIQTS